MGSKEATRQQLQLRTRQGSLRTTKIIAHCTLFVIACMAVPTLMALTKQFGWW